MRGDSSYSVKVGYKSIIILTDLRGKLKCSSNELDMSCTTMDLQMKALVLYRRLYMFQIMYLHTSLDNSL